MFFHSQKEQIGYSNIKESLRVSNAQLKFNEDLK